MRVSLQALRAFESAARLGSFKAAAEELALSPTAISHHVNNLESRLSINLFHRQTRQITLTSTGKILAEATYEGFRKIEEALDQVKTEASLVRVTTTSSLAAMLLLPCQQDFSKNYPDITVQVSTGENIDKKAYMLSIRLGDARIVNPSDIIKYESFNMFGPHNLDSHSWHQSPGTIYTTNWKNESLPKPPLENWMEINGVDWSNIKVKKFDQELFGVQQAMVEGAAVFCSNTLANGTLVKNFLKKIGTKSITSDLCYYVPNKDRLDTQNSVAYLDWVTNLIK